MPNCCEDGAKILGNAHQKKQNDHERSRKQFSAVWSREFVCFNRGPCNAKVPRRCRQNPGKWPRKMSRMHPKGLEKTFPKSGAGNSCVLLLVLAMPNCREDDAKILGNAHQKKQNEPEWSRKQKQNAPEKSRKQFSEVWRREFVCFNRGPCNAKLPRRWRENPGK